MAVEDSVFKIINEYFKNFIKEYPMLALALFIGVFWVPLIPTFVKGGSVWDPMLNIWVMQFEYAAIPVGLSIMYVVFLPIYYFYVKPHDAKLRQRKLAEFDKIQRQKEKVLKDFWNR